MRAQSAHIKFPKDVNFKDLLSVYNDLYTMFLEETNQVSDEEGYTNMLLRTNLIDLEANRKPEGFNRYGSSMRMIFPINDGGVTFYLYTNSKNKDVVKITENISKFLHTNGLEHEIEWDKMLLYNTEKRA